MQSNNMITAKKILETIKLRCELDLCGLSEAELLQAIDDIIQANQSQRILELEEHILELEWENTTD